MNIKNSFDEYVKEKLANHEAGVPVDLWNRISKETNRRKPFFVWFFSKHVFFLMLTTVFFIGGYYAYLIAGKSAFTVAINPLSNSNYRVAEVKKENKPLTVSALSKDPVLKSKYTSKPNSTNVMINAVSPGIDLTVGTADAKEIQKNHNLLTATNKRSNKKVKTINHFAQNQLMLQESGHYVENSNDEESVGKVVKDFSKESILTPRIYSVELLELFSTKKTAYKVISKHGYNIPCPTFNGNSTRFYTDFYTAADIVNRQFSDTANSIYLQKRKEGNTINSAFSFGIRLTKLFKSGITISGGINYSQIIEKFKFTQGNIIQTVYETNASGDTIGSYQTISTRYKITHNQYRNIDFPITIGYEKSFNNWSLGFNGGLIFNLFSTYKGDVLDKNFQPIGINESALEKRYKLKGNIGMGCTGGISVYYNLTERLKLLAEPYFRYNLSEMNQDASEFKQKYHTIGMKAGIRLDMK